MKLRRKMKDLVTLAGEVLPEQQAQIRESIGAAGAFEVFDVTNAQRLAGTRSDDTTPLVAGDKVRVTDQANRIEQALNADDFSDNDNWLIIGPNTFELFVTPLNAGAVVNGVSVSQNTNSSVGWVKEGQRVTEHLDGDTAYGAVSVSQDEGNHMDGYIDGSEELIKLNGGFTQSGDSNVAFLYLFIVGVPERTHRVDVILHMDS